VQLFSGVYFEVYLKRLIIGIWRPLYAQRHDIRLVDLKQCLLTMYECYHMSEYKYGLDSHLMYASFTLLK